MRNDQYDPQLLSVEIAAAGVSIAECETENEAEFLCYVLSDAGISSGVLKPNGKFDLRHPQVRVSPDDVDRAKAVLNRPIPSGLREAFDEPVSDFEIPACQHCGSTETTLVSATPANSWKCDECGHSWVSPVDIERK